MNGMRLTRRAALLGSAAVAASARAAKAAEYTVGFIYVGSGTTTATTRPTPRAPPRCKQMAGVNVVEQDKVPETAAVAEDDGEHDPSRRRHARSSRPPSAISTRTCCKRPPRTTARSPSCIAAGCGRRATRQRPVLFRLYRRGGVCLRHRRRAYDQGQEVRLRRGQADPAGAAQHQRLHARRADGRSDHHHPGDLHRRLVDAGASEAEATNSLADQGVDVITCHVDSPKVVIETAAKRGLYTCGYHANQAALAPKGYLTGAEWNWAELYPRWSPSCSAARRSPTSSAAASRKASSRPRPTPRSCRRRRASRPTRRARPSSRPAAS